MIVFIILALALVEAETNLCNPTKYPISDLTGGNAEWAFGCIDATHACSCEKSTGILKDDNFEIPFSSALLERCKTAAPACGTAAKGTTAATANPTAGTTITAPITVASPIQLSAQPLAPGIYTSGLPPAQGCQFGNKCKEFDEVWKILTERGIVAVEQSKIGMIWDPPTNTWKSFAETYNPKPVATPTTPIVVPKVTGTGLTKEQVEWIYKYSAQEGIMTDKVDGAALILALVGGESSGNVHAVSGTGCSGLLQVCTGSADPAVITYQCPQKTGETRLCDPTKCGESNSLKIKASNLCDNCGSGNTVGCVNDERFDPEKNIHAAVLVLKGKMGSVKGCSEGETAIKCWIAAYNAGHLPINAAAKEAAGSFEGQAPNWDQIYTKLNNIALFRANGYADDDETFLQNKINNLKGYVSGVYSRYLGFKGKSAAEITAKTTTDTLEGPSIAPGSLDTGSSDFTFAVISDTNPSYCKTEQGSAVIPAINKIKELNPAFVIHVGDMIAGQSPTPCTNYEAMWSGYEQAVYNPLAQVGLPLFPVKGNHDDQSYESFWNSRKSTATYLDDSGYPNRYSFTYGNFVFIVMSFSSGLSDDLRDWVLNQVEQANGLGKKSIILRHVPPSRIAAAYNDPSWYNEALFEELKTQGVQVIIAGHHQAYYKGYLGTGSEGEMLVVTAGGLADIHNYYEKGKCESAADVKTPGKCSAKAPQTFLYVRVVSGELNTILALSYDKESAQFRPYPDTLTPTVVGDYIRSTDYNEFNSWWPFS